MTTSEIGRRIYEARMRANLIHDPYGKIYEVSGPAIFKFEKSKVRPSLEKWLPMAKDTGLSECQAVLIWIRERLPEEVREYLDITIVMKEDEETYGKKNKGLYTMVKDAKKLRTMAQGDTSLPAGLRDLLADNELWALYKPMGHEIQALKTMFSGLGVGTKEMYREALRLVRKFSRGPAPVQRVGRKSAAN